MGANKRYTTSLLHSLIRAMRIYYQRRTGRLTQRPSNPTGPDKNPKETKAISQLAIQDGLWVKIDEINEHLIYDDADSTSILKAVPELADHTVIVNGVAKTYAMSEWRVG